MDANSHSRKRHRTHAPQRHDGAGKSISRAGWSPGNQNRKSREVVLDSGSSDEDDLDDQRFDASGKDVGDDEDEDEADRADGDGDSDEGDGATAGDEIDSDNLSFELCHCKVFLPCEKLKLYPHSITFTSCSNHIHFPLKPHSLPTSHSFTLTLMVLPPRKAELEQAHEGEMMSAV